GHLGLDARLQQPVHRHGLAFGAVHVGEERAEVGLVDPELLLHGRGGQADLAPDHAGARGDPRLRDQILYAVRDGDVVGTEEVAHRTAWCARRRGLFEPVRGHADRGVFVTSLRHGGTVALEHRLPSIVWLNVFVSDYW